MLDLSGLITGLERTRLTRTRGRLINAIGPMIEAEIPGAIVGGLCEIEPDCLCEVVGFKGRRALLMPLQDTEGVKFGGDVWWKDDQISVAVGDALIGRIVDGLGEPIDGGPLESEHDVLYLQMHPTRLAVHSSHSRWKPGSASLMDSSPSAEVNVSLLWQGLVSVNRH